MNDESTRTPSEEHRRYPRIQILGRVAGKVLTVSEPVAVLDMSVGGLAIQTGVMFPIGSRQELRLTLETGALLTMFALVVHSMRAHAADGSTYYVSGLHFVEVNAEETLAIQTMIASLQST